MSPPWSRQRRQGWECQQHVLSQGILTMARALQSDPGHPHHGRAFQSDPGQSHCIQDILTMARKFHSEPGHPQCSQDIFTTARAFQSDPGHPQCSQDILTMARASLPQLGHPQCSQDVPTTTRVSLPCPGHPHQSQDILTLQVGAVCSAAETEGAAPQISTASSFLQPFPNMVRQAEQSWSHWNKGDV